MLYDENDVKITATGLSYTSYAAELNVTIENNSDKDLSFICNSVGYNCNAINGYMVDDGYLSADVAAGKKANETISFSVDMLALYGITEIADIQVGFDIKDGDYEGFQTGVRQVKTSAAGSYDYETDTFIKAMKSGVLEKFYEFKVEVFLEEEMYNEGDIRMVSEPLVTNKDGEQILFLEVENNSAEMVYGVTADICINGLAVCSSTWSSDTMNPGTRRIMDISLLSVLDKNYREAFGISDISEVSFTLEIKNADYEELIAPREIEVTLSDKESAFDASGEEVYNENDIRIVSKGVFKDSSEGSEDMHLLLLVENNSSETIDLDDAYDSLSVNGFMMDYIMSMVSVPSGKSGVIDIEMQGSSLADNDSTNPEDIKDAEITFEIKDKNYNTIAEPKVGVKY